MGKTWNGCSSSDCWSHSQTPPPVTRGSWVLTQEQCPQGSSCQCDWWGIDNQQLLPPHQWSPQKSSPNLGSRPVRAEIALSNSIYLPILRKKISTVTAQKQRWAAKSFSLHTYFVGLYCYMISSSHGPKMGSATLHKVPVVACRYLLFTVISGGPR